MWDQTTVLIAQTIVLAITAVILVWYTWETRQLRKIQQWPLVLAKGLEAQHVILANVGNSPAMNIRAAGYLLRQEDALQQAFDAGQQLRSSDVILQLASGTLEKVRVDHFSREFAGGLKSELWGEVNLVAEPPPNLTLRIEFQNMAMERFFAEQIILIGSIRLVRAVKEWALFRLFHRTSQDLLTIKLTADGQIDCTQLTPRGQRLQTEPLRP
jgi:hypothetical protein